ncbi:MAG: hypothetical protein SCARUB_01522 [Candidatus Scalindua rubra]|uniref:Uncharacterized protein n=1 Tax=Candidatus Scalindua rubra TaxID=1872076 RepID=A0A1E3XCJ0_9BACT|nr:MAG: hypothetical protein SCARUB_01522 [Candidatus Scalindua rubra]
MFPDMQIPDISTYRKVNSYQKVSSIYVSERTCFSFFATLCTFVEKFITITRLFDQLAYFFPNLLLAKVKNYRKEVSICILS